MDLIHKVLNIVIPPITLTLLLLFLPPFLVFKFIGCIKRYVNSEKVVGKVVQITGASSGIGEYLAYEYARRGACLALAARREERLRAVADKARLLGSPDVIVISTDISKVEDCERFINKAVNHFGQLDHLVNNAGIIQVKMFEDCKISDFGTFMASKAAITSFYETLSTEFGSDIGITIVTPGVVESEMTQGDFISKAESIEMYAKAIVDSACRRDRYLVELSWARNTFLLKVLYPRVLERYNHRVFIASTSKKST